MSSKYSVEDLLSYSTKNIRTVALLSFRKFRVSKVGDRSGGRGGSYVSPTKSCCLTVPKKIVGEPLRSFRKFLVSKIFVDKRERGGFQFPPAKFCCCTVLKKFCRVTLLSFRKLLLSKSFMDRRGRGGGYNFSPSKLWCVTVWKRIKGGPLWERESFWYRTFFLDKGRGSYHDVPSKIFGFKVPKIFVG